MKKAFGIRKILAVVFAVLICMSSFSMRAFAEEQPDEDKEGFIVETHFDVSTTSKQGTWDFKYNDRWFKQSATVYNHNLARLSLGMALSAFRPNLDPDGKENPALHLQNFLKTCRFKDLRTDDYDKNPSLYTVSTVIAHKRLSDGKGDFELLVVGVCGGGYRNEWMSNFSCGDDKIHLGFLSAAEEVYDRLFGYIASNGLTGQRIKVWVSGFSRAGAITNIFSKLLVDSDVLDSDSVYAYTFATPRTTREHIEGDYPNIYNICGKMDPVPQLAFADWGFDRYGTTLYTPSQQTDSDYNIKAARANQVHEKNFGLKFFNNVEWDTKLRVILNYVLKIAPTSKIYKNHIQDYAVRMWENKSLSNIMTCLMELAGDKELITDENKTEANSMLTYLAYTIYGFATKSDVESQYRSEDSTLVGNLAREHTPEVYLSWMYSTDDPEELFSDSMNYVRLVVEGDVDVGIISYGVNYGLAKCMLADGTTANEMKYGTIEMEKEDPFAPDIFMARNKGQTIVLLPKDRNYGIVIKSNASQRIEVHGIPLTVGFTNNNFNKMHYANLEKDEYDIIFSAASDYIYTNDDNSDIVTGDTFDVVDVSIDTSSELAIALEKVNFLNLGWRPLVIITYTIPIVLINLLLCLIAWGIGSHRIKRRKKAGLTARHVKYDRRPAACIFAVFTLFMIQELIYWLMPEYMHERAIMKLVIGVLLMYLCYRGLSRQPSELSTKLLVALCICTAGDMTINFSFVGSMVMFGAAEAILTYQFTRHEKMEKWQYVLWALGSFAAVVIIYLNTALKNDMKYSMVAYSVILMAMVAGSLTMPKRIRSGAIMMAVSNILLFINEVSTKKLLIHILSLGIYYLAMGFFAYATRYKVVTQAKDGTAAEVEVS